MVTQQQQQQLGVGVGRGGHWLSGYWHHIRTAPRGARCRGDLLLFWLYVCSTLTHARSLTLNTQDYYFPSQIIHLYAKILERSALESLVVRMSIQSNVNVMGMPLESFYKVWRKSVELHRMWKMMLKGVTNVLKCYKKGQVSCVVRQPCVSHGDNETPFALLWVSAPLKWVENHYFTTQPQTSTKTSGCDKLFIPTSPPQRHIIATP